MKDSRDLDLEFLQFFICKYGKLVMRKWVGKGSK